MLNKKDNLNSGKNKDKKKRISMRNKTGNQAKRERIHEKAFVIKYFDVVPFMKQKQRIKKKRMRKTRNQRKAKKKDKKEGRKTRTRERERERETEKEKVKKGEAKEG